MSEHAGVDSWDWSTLWLKAAPCLLLAVGILYLFPLSSLNLPGLALMTASLGWCIYQYLLPVHLIRRRSLLEHVTSGDSVLRRLLWKGSLSRFLLLWWSLLLALMVLMAVDGLQTSQWLVLLAGVPLLCVMLKPALRLAGPHSDLRFQLPLALRLAVYLTIVVCTSGLVALQLFGEGVSDTRQLSLLQVVQASWSAAQQTGAVTQIGWLLGLEAVSNDVAWYLMQQASSLGLQPDWPLALRIAVWLGFLLLLTVKIAVFWFALAGLLSWVLSGLPVKHKPADLLQGVSPGKTFIQGLAVLAVCSYLLAQPGVSGFLTTLVQRSVQVVPRAAVDPCLRRAPEQLAQLQQVSLQADVSASDAFQRDMERRVDVELDRAFALATPALEQYLDWNFSLGGQYSQLAMLLYSKMADAQQLENHIQERFEQTVGAALTPALSQATTTLPTQFAAGAQQLYLQQAQYVEELMAASDCLRPVLPALAVADLLHKSAVGSGPVIAAVATGLSLRSGVSAGAGVVGRTLAKRVASTGSAKVVTRVGAKVGQSGVAAGSSVLCGPAFGLCASGMFLGTWLLSDLLINKVDETLHRDALRASLLAELEQEKQRLKAEYSAVFAQGLSQLRLAMDGEREQRFEILRDGLGREKSQS